MKNLNSWIIVFVLVLIVCLVLWNINDRVNKIESAQNRSDVTYNLSYVTNISSIEKVEGNGNAFGNDNKIENKAA